MTDPHDDALRAALRAEAGETEAGPELLARIRSAGHPTPRRRPLLLAAAAAIVALGVAAIGLALANDGDESLRVVDTPGSTSTTLGQQQATVCTTTAIGNPPCGDATADLPPRLVFVREDGWLVTMDLGSGEQQELYQYGDPSPDGHAVEEGGPYYIDEVQLAGDWIYFSTCCEPASGVIYRIPSTGGEPTTIAFGTHPAVSPDGRYLAATSGDGVDVYDLNQPSADTTVPVAAHLAMGLDRSDGPFEWSPDGRRLAWTSLRGSLEADPIRGFHEASFARGELTALDDPFPAEPGLGDDYVVYRADGELERHPIPADYRTVEHDASGRWALWIDRGLGLRFQDGNGDDRLPIAGTPKAIAADW